MAKRRRSKPRTRSVRTPQNQGSRRGSLSSFDLNMKSLEAELTRRGYYVTRPSKRSPPPPTFRGRARQLARVIRSPRETLIDTVALSFADKKRPQLRKALTAVDKCVRKCKGNSKRRKGAFRGRTHVGFANFVKDKICQVRCR
jgi:hypothetical protein